LNSGNCSYRIAWASSELSLNLFRRPKSSARTAQEKCFSFRTLATILLRAVLESSLLVQNIGDHMSDYIVGSLLGAAVIL
jgi:hypothetical protein